MSKEKNVPLSVALAGVNVDAGIDMKLSKSDLVDMIVEERKEQIENELRELASRSQSLRDAFSNAHKTIEIEVLADLKTKYASLIKAFKKTFPGSKEHHSCGHESYYHSQFVRRDENPSDDGDFWPKHVEDTSDKNSRGYKPYLSVEYKLGDFDTHEKSRGAALTFGLSATQEQLDRYRTAAKQALEKQVEHENTILALRQELKGLSKKGGRFKADLTKRLLAGTQQGQALLGALDGVRKLANCQPQLEHKKD